MIPAIDAHHHFWNPDTGDYPWMVGPVLPNVWCKLSGMVTEAGWATWTKGKITPYIAEVLRVFGPQRCLMGTDWPVCLLAANDRQAVMLVRDAIAGLPEPDQRAILWDSAVDVYRLAEGRL